MGFFCLSIPEYVAQVDTEAHTLKILIGILSLVRWEVSACSSAVCKELPKRWPTGKHDTKFEFEEAEKICGHYVPYDCVNGESWKDRGRDPTCDIFSHGFLSRCGGPSDTQCGCDQTKVEDEV